MGDYKKLFIFVGNKGFNLNIKVKAAAKSNSIEGTICIDNLWYLKLTIKADPEHGKANKAIIDFLSQKWLVPKKAISIIKGLSSNYKVLNIRVDNLTEAMLT